MSEHVVAQSEFLVRPSRRVASSADANCFKNTASTQLRQDHGSFKLPSFFRLVGLDTPDVVSVGRVDGIHETDAVRVAALLGLEGSEL